MSSETNLFTHGFGCVPASEATAEGPSRWSLLCRKPCTDHGRARTSGSCVKCCSSPGPSTSAHTSADVRSAAGAPGRAEGGSEGTRALRDTWHSPFGTWAWTRGAERDDERDARGGHARLLCHMLMVMPNSYQACIACHVSRSTRSARCPGRNRQQLAGGGRRARVQCMLMGMKLCEIPETTAQRLRGCDACTCVGGQRGARPFCSCGKVDS